LRFGDAEEDDDDDMLCEVCYYAASSKKSQNVFAQYCTRKAYHGTRLFTPVREGSQEEHGKEPGAFRAMNDEGQEINVPPREEPTTREAIATWI